MIVKCTQIMVLSVFITDGQTQTDRHRQTDTGRQAGRELSIVQRQVEQEYYSPSPEMQCKYVPAQDIRPFS